MKTVIALALTLAAASAHAGSFNDRGELFTDTVRPAAAAETMNYRAQVGGFNDRGDLYSTVAPTGSQQMSADTPAVLNGYNDQGNYVVDVRSVDSNMPG